MTDLWFSRWIESSIEHSWFFCVTWEFSKATQEESQFVLTRDYCRTQAQEAG